MVVAHERAKAGTRTPLRAHHPPPAWPCRRACCVRPLHPSALCPCRRRKKKKLPHGRRHAHIHRRSHSPSAVASAVAAPASRAAAPASSIRSSSSRTPGAGESAGLCSGETGPA
ncbi:hypothetical protein GGP41_000769 [Bipolaris sorokiniana]|uniref:Uncharacterized protein n=1 Tax=Cochliobolus sativus TaxID=45130 RepID=A0A8H6DXZ3_COCSA|nr:hypothetical protein GGP41_000769 [Bipolaris sorokiniana]